MINFSQKDLKQLERKGISKERVIAQMHTFQAGIPFVPLVRAAVVSDGILRLSAEEQQQLVRHFEATCNTLKLLKFVPASGAASRMFAPLFHFLENYTPSQNTLSAYVEQTGNTAIQTFAAGIEQLPFYNTIAKRSSGKAADKEAVYHFVREMLSGAGRGYGGYPKALLPFHRYGTATATPFEEHLKEATRYAKANSKARLHFTIAQEHQALFQAEQARVVPKIAKATHTTFAVTYSYQKPSTDTLAVAMNNQPFRDGNGNMVFRPGGHGALLENLNEQDADIIFIKNIDNVVVDNALQTLETHKKMLAGLLLKIQAQAFVYAEALESETLSAPKAEAIKTFLETALNVRLPKNYIGMQTQQQCALLRKALNRPIRICGMVPNAGEPGGGPFWIKDAKGHTSLQIVETAQINTNDAQQAAILKSATHFNPVDLVCGIKNYKGEPYNLLEFIAPQQGFIRKKTKEGKELKALELPGLWNGAMAFWNTVFVEVPASTFNPVKTVVDLLRPTHQTQNEKAPK